MHPEGVNQHEDDADEREEQDVHRARYERLGVGPGLVQLAQELPGTLILESGVGQGKGMRNSPFIQGCAHALDDDVHVIVLEILGQAGDERHADGQEQQQSDPGQEFRGGERSDAACVAVDKQTEYLRIEQGEDLVHGGEAERQDQGPAIP